MEELKTDTRENAETYISNNPVVLSTHAKFSFGTLRAARRYKRNPRNRNEWNSRFDDVELYVSGTEQTVDDEQTNVKIDDRWFARCAAFIKIGDFQGAFIQSFVFLKMLRSYPEQSQDIPILKWWPESQCSSRNKDTRLRGDIIHLRIIPIESIKSRLCLVPDWSSEYVSPTQSNDHRKKISWKEQRFILNSDYILL